MIEATSHETGKKHESTKGSDGQKLASPQHRILIVDDDESVARLIGKVLEEDGAYQPVYAATLAAGKSQLAAAQFDAILLDLTLPDGMGLDLLETAQELAPDTSTLVLTGDASLDTAVTAIRRGAFDFLTKPVDFDLLLARISHAIERKQAGDQKALQECQRRLDSGGQIVAPRSEAMKGVYDRVRRVAGHEYLPVLIWGETGSGKEHVAKMIHDSSPRVEEAFIAVNCANLDKNLLQSELFGHERGAFTGATERRKGIFELASRGTLFLDEVGEMPLDVQAAFLRVLETRKFHRLGGSAELETHVRVIAATNKDLKKLVKEGKFREDLYYRLNVVEIVVPSLRERTEDIEPLARHFVEMACRTAGVEAQILPDAMAALRKYPWPGNVRELRHVIERTILLRGGGEVRAGDVLLSSDTTKAPSNGSGSEAAQGPAHGAGEMDIAEGLTLAQVEYLYVTRTLERCKGNRTHAAAKLGISRNTLVRKLQEGGSAPCELS
ncbi:MAG: sigma-54 dependent transcriptional regulator [Bdellovibrionota bacterium]